MINYILFFVIPFIVGAAFEFLPLWVSIPAAFVLSLMYMGNMVVIAIKNRTNKK